MTFQLPGHSFAPLYWFIRSIVYFDAMRFSLSSLIVSLTATCSAQLKPCYSINGDPASQIPCDPSANVSACCPPESVCVTNLHCHGWAVGDNFERVGGCTDKTGNDPACPFPFLRGITSCYFSFFVFKYRKNCLWHRTQTLMSRTGLITDKTLPTAAMEHYV